MNVQIRNYSEGCTRIQPVEGVAVLTQTATLQRLVDLAVLSAIKGAATTNANNSFAKAFDLTKPIVYLKLWLYPFKAVAASGQPTDNANPIWTGKTPVNTCDKLSVGDFPLKYETILGECYDLRDLNLSGTATDGVFFTGGIYQRKFQ